MPEPMGRNQRYMPGLDGLRALAVLSVVANHLNLSFAPGGLLGVGVFFTLSGYLITDLLLGQWEANGRLNLRDFWLRRARRLLPALFLMLAAVVIWVSVADPPQLGALRGNAGAAAVYVNNWWLIFHHVSYFARFGPPSSVGNLWSLAVEEQFYLIWPWLLLLGLLYVAGRPARPPTRGWARRQARTRWVLAGGTLCLAILSAFEMAALYHPTFDPTRVYDGTDTRAFGLLFGAALAMIWPSRRLRAKVTVGARRIVDGMGAVGLVGIALLVWRTDQYSAFLYRGGLVLLSLATVLVVIAATHPASTVGRALGRQPLRWIGVRSYGIYLW
ncbi:MAG: acyltransferase, partial [Acidimicrobiales bacterium]|nr:acyltransferase [Acidimicrobiales bacterium]